jgi:hypothetical protein
MKLDENDALELIRANRAYMVAVYKELEANLDMVLDRIPSMGENEEFLASMKQAQERTADALDLGAEVFGPPTLSEVAEAEAIVVAEGYLEDADDDLGWADLRRIVEEIEGWDPAFAQQITDRMQRLRALQAAVEAGLL